jgi:hypothetical protein
VLQFVDDRCPVCRSTESPHPAHAVPSGTLYTPSWWAEVAVARDESCRRAEDHLATLLAQREAIEAREAAGQRIDDSGMLDRLGSAITRTREECRRLHAEAAMAREWAHRGGAFAG